MSRSVRVRLLAMLLSTILVVWLAVTLSTWWRASIEVHEVFDAQLAQVAKLVTAGARHEAKEEDFEEYESDLWRQEYESPAVFQVWSMDGRLLVRGPGVSALPLSAATRDGYTDERIDGELWRVLTVFLPDLGYRIQVAHAYSARDALIRRFVLQVLQPVLLALPIMGFLLWLGIDRGLAPLRWLADQVATRDHTSLSPVPDEGVPLEVTPLVSEINELFTRLGEALECYSRFTADAAHELRTPLAGLRVQAQSALRAGTEADRLQALAHVQQGVDRCTHLVEQLLALARIEPAQVERVFADTDLVQVATGVLAGITPKALSRGVDIQLLRGGPASVSGNAELIGVMLRNLVENSIEVTPEGGCVTVRVGGTPGERCLTVEDTGPGIPDGERGRVFERFHRLPDAPGPGSGLGLSIVQAIASLHNASVVLTDREATGGGLRVTVNFSA